MEKIKVAMLVGSHRTDSINRRLARAIEKLSPEGMTFDWVEMQHMPFYNGDMEINRPQEVRSFIRSVAACDAVCIVTPEYNRSIPAVLKNAIDWGSKPIDQNIWSDKVIAMAGASPGGIGTAVGQQHLRQILSILNGIVVPGEVYISFKPTDLIDAHGHVSDGSVRDFITGFAKRFELLVRRMHG